MFPAEVLPQMFANIKSIYKFHAEFLLPQVRESRVSYFLEYWTIWISRQFILLLKQIFKEIEDKSVSSIFMFIFGAKIQK